MFILVFHARKEARTEMPFFFGKSFIGSCGVDQGLGNQIPMSKKFYNCFIAKLLQFVKENDSTLLFKTPCLKENAKNCRVRQLLQHRNKPKPNNK